MEGNIYTRRLWGPSTTYCEPSSDVKDWSLEAKISAFTRYSRGKPFMVTQLGFRILITFSIIFLLGINLSTAQEPYFKAKTIRIIAGFPGGGGVDAESRMLARFLPAVIPGNPTIVVQNMPGAGYALSPATGWNNLPSPMA